MNILCFDISTGGLTTAILNEQLSALSTSEIPWQISTKAEGAAVLDVGLFKRTMLEGTRTIPERLRLDIDAISFSAFMHNCTVLDGSGHPTTPIFTWMDRRGREGVDLVRNELGARFHALTGCRYHPMFPVFKLASIEIPIAGKIVSAKSLAVAQLTGNWVEDHGTASATGLYDVQRGRWSEEILHIIGLRREALPSLVERDAIVGKVTPEAAARFGVTTGIPVIAGSGDGFLANAGSGCDEPRRMAVTLGTSASARQVVAKPIFNEAAGTFCYRAQAGVFLLGCASSNGGNILDWGKSVFGSVPSQAIQRADIPTFIPLLNGERSPDWNESLTGSWRGIRSVHTAADLAAAVLDGVIFNLAHYVEILTRTSDVSSTEIILSGNGFLNPLTAYTLASVVDAQVFQPRSQGLASLRGAAMCGMQALSLDPSPAIERILTDSEGIVPVSSAPAVQQRYSRYRELRSQESADRIRGKF